MLRKFLIVAAILVVSLTVVFSAAYASIYNGTVALTCTDWTALNTGSHILNRDNTGSGMEALRIDITDGAGNLIYTLTYSNFLTEFSGGIGYGLYDSAPQYNPITFKLTSLAGNGFAEQVDYVSQGNCAGLPTFGSCIALTADAVVGDMPFATQADWAPGKEANGVVVNPGTYWVLGVDETGQYYEIVLSCQYLWVPVSSMQPSFQPPQNGQPLPTSVVS